MLKLGEPLQRLVVLPAPPGHGAAQPGPIRGQGPGEVQRPLRQPPLERGGVRTLQIELVVG